MNNIISIDEKRIRKLYGEKMWHLCRSLFATILDTKGLLSNLLENNFFSSRFLYEDIVNNHLEEEFKDFIYSFIDVEKKEVIVNKTAQQLMDEAGYILYECKTEDDIQSFRRYYEENETLCTIENGGRLNRCHVFFAVKKNVASIKRQNFTHPKREDEYGTSVISIQFTRGNTNTLSIKNRYNHTVNNPDATFHNNLEDIIPGLTHAFERDYNLNINQNNNRFNITDYNYVKANDGKYYKYKYEVDNTYFGPDNIVISNFEPQTRFFEKEKYLVFDYFILDLVNKKNVKIAQHDDSFCDLLTNIKKIDIRNDGDIKNVIITSNNGEEQVIRLDKYNRIISYENDYVKRIGDRFLDFNDSMLEVKIPNVIEIGDYFLWKNGVLKQIVAPNVKKIGVNFLYCNERLIEADFSNVIEIGECFMIYNNVLKKLNLQNVEFIGQNFLCNNKVLNEFIISDNVNIEYGFLRSHNNIFGFINRGKVR